MKKSHLTEVELSLSELQLRRKVTCKIFIQPFIRKTNESVFYFYFLLACLS